MSQTSAVRYHDICAGHRVVGHESKCKNLHGHNYRFHFYIRPEGIRDSLDDVGRVLDFSVIKARLADWLEVNWDHKMLLWDKDPLSGMYLASHGVISVPFNPTAENIAQYFVREVAPVELKGTGCLLYKLVIEETRKCSVIYEI